MSFEPQKFFIGLVDFFAVWLPGALLAYLIKDDFIRIVLGDNYRPPEGNEGWVVFLFASYLLGHFIFLTGSYLLDDKVYDRIREATEWEQILRLSKGEKMSNSFLRFLGRVLIKNDETLRQVIRIKDAQVDPRIKPAALNAFQWCKARLVLNHPAAMESIQRFEADSKFFRSLVMVCLIIFILLLADAIYLRVYGDRLIANVRVFAFCAVPVGLLAFWRYVEQRLKAIKQAYGYIITLEGGKAPSSGKPAGELTHAGGVVVRKLNGRIYYLLVTAKKDPAQLVLPKGHIEEGESPRETAVREVHEETGIWAGISENGDLGTKSFTANGERVEAGFFLMEYVEPDKPRDKNRELVWQSFDNAAEQKGKPLHPETKELLREAAKKLSIEIKLD
jgi:8-oxo-dGTP pyrophosphatase MutT (NUDIX family)